jgi:hypothetical protein
LAVEYPGYYAGSKEQERDIAKRKQEPIPKGVTRHRATRRRPIRCASCGLKFTRGYYFFVALRSGPEHHLQ